MTDEQKSVEHKLPDAVVNKLRVAYLRGVGAAQAAEAARQVSVACFNEYQQQLGACIEMLGLDPNAQWEVNFDLGAVAEHVDAPATNGVPTAFQTASPSARTDRSHA